MDRYISGAIVWLAQTNVQYTAWKQAVFCQRRKNDGKMWTLRCQLSKLCLVENENCQKALHIYRYNGSKALQYICDNHFFIICNVFEWRSVVFYNIDRIKCYYGAYDSIILLYCKMSTEPKLIDLILFSQDIPERQHAKGMW